MPPFEPQDETLDPRAPRSMRLVVSEPSRARVEVLFHSDLRRVGDAFALGDQPVVIGRDSPAFASRDGVSAPLADPCVSRRQLTVCFRQGRFEVQADASARRPLAFFGPGVEACPVADSYAPGTLVAIGDRVLLRLAKGPDEADDVGLIGRSDAAVALRRSIHALADGTQTVLVRGETGVGKELVARALHTASSRASAPFVAVNCAALPENLVESELFGHARGAFSGAATAKDGLFRAAGRGTIFLDEIGELPLSVQAKLLRTLQERSVRPLGDSRELPFEARVVTATNRDLAVEVEEGRFRADLYARLEAPEIVVPPLRERAEDVALLFAHFFAAQVAALGDDTRAGRALRALVRPADVEPPPIPLEHVLDLMRHRWPRNVRELERHVAGLVGSIAETGAFRAKSPASVRPPGPDSARPPAPSTPPAKGRPELDELLRVLDAHDYVQQQVARALGVSRTTLDKWMRELGVRRPKDVPDAELLAAVRAHGRALDAAARALRVSLRGLRLRLTELGVPPDSA